MSDDVRWLTYAELAEALGIGADSARNLVRRKRWSRKPGNDGLARVGVPVEHLERAAVDRAADGASEGAADAGIDPPTNPPADGPSDEGIVAILNRHIERLEGETGLLQSELFVERATAAQVGALQAVLAIERQRIAELRQERDRLLDRMLTPPAPGVWARLRRAMGG
jgi:hypothetical protein